MNADEFQHLIEEFQAKLREHFGVTVQTDHKGAWGDAGLTYVTVRWNRGEKLCEVHMRVINVEDFS